MIGSRVSQHTPETILRIRRLADTGLSQSDIGRMEGLDRHQVADIIDGMFDHLVPAHKCPSCHRMVHGPCVACLTPAGRRLSTSEGGLELALVAEDAVRFGEVRHGARW